jgi:hypothetical protein
VHVVNIYGEIVNNTPERLLAQPGSGAERPGDG